MSAFKSRILAGPGALLSGLSLLTIIYLVGVWLAPSWLIGDSQYQWPVLRHGSASRLPVAALILGLAAGLGILLAREADSLLNRKHGKLRVFAALFFIGLAFQAGPAAVHRYGLIELPLRVHLADHTSYFADAVRARDLKSWLADQPLQYLQLEKLLAEARRIQAEGDSQALGRLWAEADQLMHTHTRTHPPGAVAVCFGVQALARSLPSFSQAYADLIPRSGELRKNFALSESQLAAGGILALLMILLAAAAGPLCFAIGRIMTDNQRAVWAALFFMSAPAFAHKTPVLDHALGVIILLALWLTLSAVVSRQAWRVCLAGAIIGAGLWLGLTLLAGLVLCVLLAGACSYQYRREGTRPRNLVILLGSFTALLGICAFVGAFGLGLLFDLNLVKVYHDVADTAWNFNNLVSGRVRAWKWMAFNFYEVMAFAGLPLFALFAAAALKQARGLIRGETGALDPWLWAGVVFLLALNFSGKVCYEASRLCWFCFPLLALFGVRHLHFRDDRVAVWVIGVLLALQIVSTLVFRMVF